MMDCFYINLNHETEKRDLLEANFARHNTKAWPLQRFEALDKKFVRANRIEGELSEGAKGCFLSHRALMNQHIDHPTHLFIVEDDVVFCSQTQEVIDRVTQHEDMAWDMLYTDVCVPDAAQMIELFQMKQTCAANNEMRVLDLANLYFASTAAYVVNQKSIAKVAALLNAEDALNTPIDLHYRHLIHSGKLKAFVTFPFLTSLSSRSEDSNIQTQQHAYTELVWHSFRKLIWIDGKPQDIQKNLALLEQGHFNAEAQAFATILGGVFSSDFVLK